MGGPPQSARAWRSPRPTTRGQATRAVDPKATGMGNCPFDDYFRRLLRRPTRLGLEKRDWSLLDLQVVGVAVGVHANRPAGRPSRSIPSVPLLSPRNPDPFTNAVRRTDTTKAPAASERVLTFAQRSMALPCASNCSSAWLARARFPAWRSRRDTSSSRVEATLLPHSVSR